MSGGGVVDVDLELDGAPCIIEVSEDFAAALEVMPDAKAAFHRLSYSHQRQHVEAVTGAKQPETRRRRIDKAIDMLTEGGRDESA